MEPTATNCIQILMQAGLEKWALGRTKVRELSLGARTHTVIHHIRCTGSYLPVVYNCDTHASPTIISVYICHSPMSVGTKSMIASYTNSVNEESLRFFSGGPSASRTGLPQVLPCGAPLSNCQQLWPLCHQDSEECPPVAGAEKCGQTQRGEEECCSHDTSWSVGHGIRIIIYMYTNVWLPTLVFGIVWYWIIVWRSTLFNYTPSFVFSAVFRGFVVRRRYQQTLLLRKKSAIILQTGMCFSTSEAIFNLFFLTWRSYEFEESVVLICPGKPFQFWYIAQWQ